jgi:ribosomal protein L10
VKSKKEESQIKMVTLYLDIPLMKKLEELKYKLWEEKEIRVSKSEIVRCALRRLFEECREDVEEAKRLIREEKKYIRSD